MARTELTVNTIPANGGGIQNLTLTAGDATNDHQFDNDGNTLLYVQNTGAGAVVVTIVSVDDEFGRQEDTVLTVPITTGESLAGPFLPANFNQPGRKIFVDLDIDAGVSLAAVRYQQRR